MFDLFTQMFGARQKGVRAVVFVEDKPGQLAKVTGEISKAGANIISAVTTKHDADNRLCLTFKITGIDEKKMKSILEDCEFEIHDLRVV